MSKEDQTPVTTPIQPVTPANPEEKAKELLNVSKGRNWLPIIMVVILLLLLSGGVVAGMTIFKDQIPFMAVKQNPTSGPIVIPTLGLETLPTQEPISDEMIIKECPANISKDFTAPSLSTKDWKTYVVKNRLLQFRYPADWKILEENSPDGVLVNVACSGCNNKGQTVDSFKISEVNYKNINDFLSANKSYQRYNVIDFWDREGLSLSFPGDENGAVKGYFGFYNGVAYLIEIRYPGMVNKKAICPFEVANPDIFLTFSKP